MAYKIPGKVRLELEHDELRMQFVVRNKTMLSSNVRVSVLGSVHTNKEQYQ